jgi:hypothetical protein
MVFTGLEIISSVEASQLWHSIEKEIILGLLRRESESEGEPVPFACISFLKLASVCNVYNMDEIYGLIIDKL